MCTTTETKKTKKGSRVKEDRRPEFEVVSLHAYCEQADGEPLGYDTSDAVIRADDVEQLHADLEKLLSKYARRYANAL